MPDKFFTLHYILFVVTAEETHQFTIEQIKEGDSNYRSIWMQMENFVHPENTGNIRFVHCLVSLFSCHVEVYCSCLCEMT